MSRIFVPCIFPRNLSRFPIACVVQSDENSGMNTEHLAKELRLIADRLVDLASRLSSEHPSAMPRKTANNICTRCGKPIPENVKPVRGAHYACYRRLIRMVREGLLTEEEVVAAGMLLPPEPGGRLPSTKKLDYAAKIKEEARLAVERAKAHAKREAKPE